MPKRAKAREQQKGNDLSGPDSEGRVQGLRLLQALQAGVGPDPTMMDRHNTKNAVRDALITIFGVDDAMAIAEGVAWDLGMLKSKVAERKAISYARYDQPESDLKYSDVPRSAISPSKKKATFRKSVRLTTGPRG